MGEAKRRRDKGCGPRGTDVLHSYASRHMTYDEWLAREIREGRRSPQSHSAAKMSPAWMMAVIEAASFGGHRGR
jgi:hypothetical protein